MESWPARQREQWRAVAIRVIERNQDPRYIGALRSAAHRRGMRTPIRRPFAEAAGEHRFEGEPKQQQGTIAITSRDDAAISTSPSRLRLHPLADARI